MEPKKFIEVLEQKDIEILLDTIQKEKLDIKVLFTSSTTNDNHEIWDNLLSMTLICLEKIIEYQNQDDFLNNEDYKVMMSFLLFIIKMGQEFISDKDRSTPNPLFEIVILLHNRLFDFKDAHYGIHDVISRLCETWWLEEKPGKERLILTPPMYLAIKSLELNSKIADITRLYDIRKGLLLLDLEEESSDSIKDLMLRCVMHPRFLSNPKGKRFISFLFSLYTPFIDEIHNIIKAQLVTSKKSIAQAYGEIYFNAWKSATGQFLIRIEKNCIQDLIENAIYLSDKTLLSSLRTILDYFNTQRKYKGVDKMLLTLYKPLLWRNLKVTNSLVRRNALALFINAFPLQDANANNVQVSTILQKQFNELNDLLFDSDSGVRELCVKGVSRIINIYWEMIPSAAIKLLLGKMVNHLSLDSNSAKVRLAVVEGLNYILDNFLSHSLLKEILPSSSHLFYDKADSVRVAYCKLLVTVRNVKNIHFLDIVTLDDILVRLQIDSKKPRIASVLTKLLLQNFFPSKISSQHLKTFKKIYQSNVDACFTFYSHVHLFVNLEAISLFILLQMKYIKKTLSSPNLLSSSSSNNISEDMMENMEDKENSQNNISQNNSLNNNNSLNDSSSKDRSTLVVGMLKNIRVLWDSIQSKLKLSENKELKLKLCGGFNSSMIEMLCNRFAENETAMDDILQISSYLPQQTIGSFYKNVLSQFEKLEKTSSNTTYLMILRCLYNWNKQSLVIKSISQNIGKLLESKKKVGEELMEASLVSFQIINSIMSEEKLREDLFVSEPLSKICTSLFDQVFDFLSSFFQKKKTKTQQSLFPLSFLQTCLLSFCKFNTHFQSKKDFLENKEKKSKKEKETVSSSDSTHTHRNAFYEKFIEWCIENISSSFASSFEKNEEFLFSHLIPLTKIVLIFISDIASFSFFTSHKSIDLTFSFLKQISQALMLHDEKKSEFTQFLSIFTLSSSKITYSLLKKGNFNFNLKEKYLENISSLSQIISTSFPKSSEKDKSDKIWKSVLQEIVVASQYSKSFTPLLVEKWFSQILSSFPEYERDQEVCLSVDEMEENSSLLLSSLLSNNFTVSHLSDSITQMINSSHASLSLSFDSSTASNSQNDFIQNVWKSLNLLSASISFLEAKKLNKKDSTNTFTSLQSCLALLVSKLPNTQNISHNDSSEQFLAYDTLRNETDRLLLRTSTILSPN